MSALEIYSDSSVGNNDLFLKIACHFDGNFSDTKEVIIKSVYPVAVTKEQLARFSNFENESYKKIKTNIAQFEMFKGYLRLILKTKLSLYDEDIFDYRDMAYLVEFAYNDICLAIEEEKNKIKTQCSEVFKILGIDVNCGNIDINLDDLENPVYQQEKRVFKKRLIECLNRFNSSEKMLDVILADEAYDFLAASEKSFIKNFINYHPSLKVILFKILFKDKDMVKTCVNVLKDRKEGEVCKTVVDGLVSHDKEVDDLVCAMSGVKVFNRENNRSMLRELILNGIGKAKSEKIDFKPTKENLEIQQFFDASKNCYIGIWLIDDLLKSQKPELCILRDKDYSNFSEAFINAIHKFLGFVKDNPEYVGYPNYVGYNFPIKVHSINELLESEKKVQEKKEFNERIKKAINDYDKELFVFDKEWQAYYAQLFASRQIARTGNMALIGNYLNEFITFPYSFFYRFVRMWGAREYLKENEQAREEALDFLKKDTLGNEIAGKLFDVMTAILNGQSTQVMSAVENANKYINERLQLLNEYANPNTNTQVKAKKKPNKSKKPQMRAKKK